MGNLKLINHFRWPVPNLGYQWDSEAQPCTDLRDHPLAPAPFLTEHPGSTRARIYSPLEKTAEKDTPLFVRFTQLGGEPEEIVRFANAYGWLGIGKLLYKDERTFNGESLAWWRKEVGELRRAVEVWQAAQSSKAQERDFLRSVFTWDREAETVSVEVGGKWELLSRRADDRQLYDLIVTGDAIVHAWAARAFVLDTVNKHLEANVAPCLLFADRHRNLAGYLRPGHLLGALWLQFYQAILGERPVRQCAYCRELMEVPKGSRSTKILHDRCGNAKKMAAYRRRQRQATAMAGRGVPIKQIAHRLGTDAGTVKKWVSRHEGRRP